MQPSMGLIRHCASSCPETDSTLTKSWFVSEFEMHLLPLPIVLHKPTPTSCLSPAKVFQPVFASTYTATRTAFIVCSACKSVYKYSDSSLPCITLSVRHSNGDMRRSGCRLLKWRLGIKNPGGKWGKVSQVGGKRKRKEKEEEVEVLRSDKSKVTNCHVAPSWLLLLACCC